MTFCNALQTVDLRLYASLVATFGENLKARRDAVGLPQEALAKLLGHKRPSTVQAWEKNRRRPRSRTVRILAEHLKCSPADLLVGVEGDYDGLRGETTQGQQVNGRAVTPNEARVVRILRAIPPLEQRDAIAAFARIARHRAPRPPKESSAPIATPRREAMRPKRHKSRHG